LKIRQQVIDKCILLAARKGLPNIHAAQPEIIKGIGERTTNFTADIYAASIGFSIFAATGFHTQNGRQLYIIFKLRQNSGIDVLDIHQLDSDRQLSLIILIDKLRYSIQQLLAEFTLKIFFE